MRDSILHQLYTIIKTESSIILGEAMQADLERPIGVFDSGLGGLSVIRSIQTTLPSEDIIYFGDSMNAPYGIRPVDDVKQLSFDICDRFVGQQAKAIVVACNTATSAAITLMRKRYSIPIIGMEPALKPAVEQTATGVVAVLATELTLKEEKFQILMKQFEKRREILRVPCPQLVELVERGNIEGPDAEEAVRMCFSDMSVDNLDAIVLGCTHFVFLKKVFQKLLPGVSIFDGNDGTARQLKRVLEARKLLNDSPERSMLKIDNSGGATWIERSWTLLQSNW